MKYNLILLCIVFISCQKNKKTNQTSLKDPQYITVLGIAQDAGYPQIGCKKQCCKKYYNGISKKKHVVSLGLVDKEKQQKWLFEATPDIAAQLADLEQNHLKTNNLINGVFLTHAHIGHYTGLMYLGREAIGAKETNVFVMPKMKAFLEKNAPWSQLVQLKNIILKDLQDHAEVHLNTNLKVTPFLVPHRDEFSETVGYKIEGNNKKALFIPDINKWEKWNKSIVAEVKKVDIAFLDATFLKDGEINRPMAEIPHPFIEETINLFKNETTKTKNKVVFIHFNHTNPALQDNAKEKDSIKKLGFNFAFEGMQFGL